ncbi:hypothetical protein [Pedobacter hartonius]|uniref:Uncharacterized protein n=1 Tax=Pedobacter hartonius TaxID=425514 RepID=A0A1H4FVE1_9SPHI|nr:hypothetical protein [Pedobacter hartonius]SEB01275.1 hypothetical protein SAMN05443550_108164 [Pedobacter hartonius]
MKKNLLTFILSLLIVGVYATPRVVDFRISSGSLLPGTLTLNANSSPTNFSATFTVQRGLAAGTAIPENVACVVDIVLTNQANTFKKSLSNTINFITDDVTSNYINRAISGSLSPSDVASGDQIQMRISYLDERGVKVTTLGGGFSYAISVPSTTPPPNPGGTNPTPGGGSVGTPPNWPIGSAGTVSTMAGIDITSSDLVYFWGVNGQVTVGNSTSTTGPTNTYVLPAGKQYTDVLDIAIAPTGLVYAWYKDGTISVGNSALNLGDYVAPKPFALPAGKTPADIVGISIAKNTSQVYTWYSDGTASTGNSTDLGAIRQPYAVNYPAGKSAGNLVDTGIAGSSGWVYAWYNDNTLSVGTSDSLAAYIAVKPVN